MSLLPYKVTAIKDFDATGQNVMPYASVSVLNKSGGYAALKTDETGATPLGNPFDCDVNGEKEFWILGGEYIITVDGGQSWEIHLSGASDIQMIENVAALASTPVVAGRTYYLKEYHAGTGKGGRELVGVAGSTAYDNVLTFAGSGGYFESINYDVLTSDMAGVYSDGVTPCADELENFLKYIALKTSSIPLLSTLDVVISPGEYRIERRVFLPFGTGSGVSPFNKINISAYGALFIGSGSSDADHDLFESGYIDGSGTILTTVGTAGETHLTYGKTIRGITATKFRRIFHLQNWNQACAIEDICGISNQSAYKLLRCFYLGIKNISNRDAPDQDTLPNFEIEQFANIMPVEQLNGDSHATVLKLSNCDSMTFKNCGFEGADIGVNFAGESTIVKFDTCYFEGLAVAMFDVNATLRRVEADNCWFFSTGADFIRSGISAGAYAAFFLQKNAYKAGNWAIPSNIYVRVCDTLRPDIAVDDNVGGDVEMPLTGDKVFNDTPRLRVDNASGYSGTARLLDLSKDGLNGGLYRGQIGSTVSSNDRHPFQSLTTDGTDWVFDTDIDFTENLFGSWVIDYDHSLSTFRRSYLLMGLNDSTDRVALMYSDGTTMVEENIANIVAQNNGGKLRLRVIQHTGRALTKSIVRIF